MTEKQLIDDARAGDESAWTQIFNTHYGRVLKLCRRFFAAEDAAEDMAQQVFLKFFETIGCFRGDSKISTYLHRMAVNQCLMELRRLKPRAGKVDSIDDDERFMHLPAKKALSAGEKLDLERIFARLSTGYARVLYLHDYCGFEHREISDVLGCSEGTSKSQLHKARQAARKEYNKKTNPRVYERKIFATV